MGIRQTFPDSDLREWEAYSSGGRFGLPGNSKLIFHCISDPGVAPRYVLPGGDSADVARDIREMDSAELSRLFESARELI